MTPNVSSAEAEKPCVSIDLSSIIYLSIIYVSTSSMYVYLSTHRLLPVIHWSIDTISPISTFHLAPGTLHRLTRDAAMQRFWGNCTPPTRARSPTHGPAHAHLLEEVAGRRGGERGGRGQGAESGGRGSEGLGLQRTCAGRFMGAGPRMGRGSGEAGAGPPSGRGRGVACVGGAAFAPL